MITIIHHHESIAQFIQDWATPALALIAVVVLFFETAVRNHLRFTRLYSGIDILRTPNDDDNWYFRLPITNDRSFFNDTAKNVEAWVSSVTHNSELVGEFLPAPLEWTHERPPEQNTRRSINVGQTVLLDICQWCIPDGSDAYICRIRAPHIEGIPRASRLSPGISDLSITVTQESGQTSHLKVRVNWEEVNEQPDVTILEPLGVVSEPSAGEPRIVTLIRGIANTLKD